MATAADATQHPMPSRGQGLPSMHGSTDHAPMENGIERPKVMERLREGLGALTRMVGREGELGR